MWYAWHPNVGAGQNITMNLSQSMPLVMSIFVMKARTFVTTDAVSPFRQ
jgi:hypothetical protein